MEKMSSQLLLRKVRACVLAGLSLTMVACASSGVDPYESYNRKMAAFNTGVDTVIIKPAAQGYKAIMPDPVETSVTNFFTNLTLPWTVINQLLQGRGSLAASDTGRFLVNSTVGLAGFFDVATGMGLPAHQEDFGQTLGAWGVPIGPYIVLPMIGPSSGRGLVSQYVSNFGGNIGQPILYIDHVPTRNSVFFTLLTSFRARALTMPPIPPEADLYTLQRDFYLMNRERQTQQ